VEPVLEAAEPAELVLDAAKEGGGIQGRGIGEKGRGIRDQGRGIREKGRGILRFEGGGRFQGRVVSGGVGAPRRRSFFGGDI
jgi:hypothetical protein